MRHAWRSPAFGAAWILLSSAGIACGAAGGGASSPDEPSSVGVEVPGLDVSDLTTREQRDVAAFVSELPAPCSDLQVSLKQCVNERQACGACVPAVRFLFTEVRRGKTPAQVAAAFQIRFSPDTVRTIDLGDSPAKGAARPTVVIVEWADFECSACALTAPLLDRKIKAYPEQVRLVFKHYPIARHLESELAARAGVAAARQNRFWELHNLMFLNQQLLSRDGLNRLARQAGLDMERFAQDLASPSTREAVERDRRQGDAVGLEGTPMLFINGRHFDYDHFSVLDDLDEWIQLEIEIVTGRQVEPREVSGNTWPDPPPTATSGSVP